MSSLAQLLQRAPASVTGLVNFRWEGPPWLRRFAHTTFAPYLFSAAAVAAAGLIAYTISLVVVQPHVSIFFLTAVFVSAIAWGALPSLFASVLAVAVQSPYLQGPADRFPFDDPRQFVDLCVFAIVAVLSSNLATRARRQTIAAEEGRARIATLYTFSRRLAGIALVNDIYLAILDHIGAALRRDVILLVPSAGRLVIVADRLHDRLVPEEDRARAEEMWRTGTPASPQPIDGPSGRWQFRPLVTGRGVVAILAIDAQSGERAAESGAEADAEIQDALLDQAAVAIERALLAASIEEARIHAKTEELRDAAISAISHDLQTPLASILGAATSLRRFGALYDENARGELAATIQEEAERLNDFIRNVLDLTRIRADVVSPRLETVELSDIVNAALHRAERAIAGRTVNVTLPAELPMLDLDLFLMERALVNLIENAAKYSPAGRPIRIAATEEKGAVRLEIADEGIGIAPEDRPHIFAEFFRSKTPDAIPAGTGLGLAISKAFVEANGGRIEAVSAGRGKGTTFRIVLPVPARAA